MPAFVPRFETQTDQRVPTPWTNCTFASGAMLVGHWTWGELLTDDVILRDASGVPVSRGANFAALRAAILAAHKRDLRFSEADGSGNANLTWRELRDHLAAGGAAAVAGSYAALAAHRSAAGLALDRWQPGASFGHAMLAVAYLPDDDGRVLLMDPLGHGGYAGDRVPLAALWDFIYKSSTEDAEVLVSAAHGFAGRRPPPPSPLSREARLAAEVVLRRREDPDRAAIWVANTGMTQDVDGQPLTREMRLAAEVTFLRGYCA